MSYLKLIILTITLITESKSIYRSFYLNKEKCYIDNYYSEMNVIMQLKILDTDLNFSQPKEDRFIIKIYQKKTERTNSSISNRKTKSKIFIFNK